MSDSLSQSPSVQKSISESWSELFHVPEQKQQLTSHIYTNAVEIAAAQQ